MPQDAPHHRRKSRIGPGMLLTRSVGQGGAFTTAASTATTTTTTAAAAGRPSEGNPSLFSTLRQQDDEANPLRRSQHYHPLNASLGPKPDLDHDLPIVLAQCIPISLEVGDPLDQLCMAVDKLVDTMAVVADIHAGLAQFNESFGSFLYGLKMNGGNVEWTEAPTKQSFERQEQREAEAILLQQQQEELERIRHQHLLEQEQEERRRLEEEERLEAERVKASLAMLRSSGNNSNGNTHGNYPKRTGIPVVTKGRGMAGTSRIPAARNNGARPVGSASGASRVGPGGAVRKLAGKMVMKRVADRLPLKYRDEPHRAPIEAIMRSLADNIEGQYLPDLVAVAGVARHRCNEYLGVLIHAKEVIKTSNKGVLFSLNPDRYPSR
ncbi:hypothetical protein BGZ70_000070 [Mortierella alpina]|uniref:DASH complex subunit DAM1 n=1 Tax=Mortierella alpina TaxID=64518 RepID=A0A9P6IZ17_MORAP|nr:hypothetical protein BGZ70_000070 [Mortierella alpina]